MARELSPVRQQQGQQNLKKNDINWQYVATKDDLDNPSVELGREVKISKELFSTAIKMKPKIILI